MRFRPSTSVIWAGLGGDCRDRSSSARMLKRKAMSSKRQKSTTGTAWSLKIERVQWRSLLLAERKNRSGRWPNLRALHFTYRRTYEILLKQKDFHDISIETIGFSAKMYEISRAGLTISRTRIASFYSPYYVCFCLSGNLVSLCFIRKAITISRTLALQTFHGHWSSTVSTETIICFPVTYFALDLFPESKSPLPHHSDIPLQIKLVWAVSVWF